MSPAFQKKAFMVAPMMFLTLPAGKQKNTIVSEAPTTMTTDGISTYIPMLPPEPLNSAQPTRAQVPRKPKRMPRSMAGAVGEAQGENEAAQRDV